MKEKVSQSGQSTRILPRRFGLIKSVGLSLHCGPRVLWNFPVWLSRRCLQIGRNIIHKNTRQGAWSDLTKQIPIYPAVIMCWLIVLTARLRFHLPNMKGTSADKQRAMSRELLCRMFVVMNSKLWWRSSQTENNIAHYPESSTEHTFRKFYCFLYIVAGWLRGQSSNPGRGKFFSFPRRSEQFSGPLSLLSVGTRGLFPRIWRDLDVNLTTHFQLVPRSRIRGSIHPLPAYAFMA
jgi:hypothetical protein